MKRTIIAILTIGLVAGALAAPVEAKKKKKKAPPPAPVEVKFFTHWDPDGATPEGCTGLAHMSTEDAKGDTTCSTTTQVAQEVLIAAGEDPIVNTYPASNGVPLILDASRKITGEVTLRGTVTVQAFAELELKGMIAGTETVIASGATAKGDGLLSNSAQGADLPGPAATIPIELEIDPALNMAGVSDLVLTITVRGVHRGHIDHERNPTFIVIPAFQ